jgi:AcrR family transcriptional regulator
MVKAKKRRSRQDFFQAGLDLLADEGPEALRATRLARALGVTTGSFYWHFESVDRFRKGLQLYWKDEVVVGLVRDALGRAGSRAEVLGELGELIRTRKTYRYDRGMRTWAKHDDGARRAVEDADSYRKEILSELIGASGAGKQEANDRATLIGAAWVGSQEMNDPDYRFRLIGLAASFRTTGDS